MFDLGVVRGVFCRMFGLTACILLVAVVAGPRLACGQSVVAVIPQPREMVVEEGNFVLDRATAIVAEGEAVAEADMLAECLAPALGYRLKVVEGHEARDGAVLLLLEKEGSELGAEGYRLEVTPKRIVIRAAQPAGLFYGGQTLRQLLPPAVCESRRVEGVRWLVPCVRIADRPRLAWRGLLLDPARHFLPMDYIKKVIAVMAAHKLNSLQLHLTDDQGWRIEIKKYPKLTELGSWRSETIVERSRDNVPQFDGKRHGGYYSQADIRELVEFARRYHVNLLPEIEMPGHAGAALAAYPELGCFPDRPEPVWTRWGVNPNIFNPSDRTIAFLQDVLGEVMDLFPSKFIHIGGDEAIKDYWQKCPEVQRRIGQLGLKDEAELQSWFIRQMDRFLAEHGRRLVGWDEILQGGLAPGATVMSWHGTEGGIEAAQAGHDVVMAPTTHTYFDYCQGPREKEPKAGGGFLPLERVYGLEPIPPALSGTQRRHVLGAQGQLWGEYIPTTQQADYMLWPRAAALAEVVWSDRSPRDYAGFLRRLGVHRARLDAMSVGYRPWE